MALANATTFTDATNAPDQGYSYRVVAYNAAGDGPTSNIVLVVRAVSVSTTTPTSAYNASKTITITIGFTDPVTVSGIPAVALNSGGIATYVLGSGTNLLTFNYTVSAGENASRLDYLGTGMLALVAGQSLTRSSIRVVDSPSSRIGGRRPVCREHCDRHHRADDLGEPRPREPGRKRLVQPRHRPSVFSYSASDNVGGSGRRRHHANGSYAFPDGASQTYTFTVYDLAGNSVSVSSPVVNVYTVAPVLSAAINAAASTGWYNLSTGAAVATYTATDATSGVTTPVPYTFSDGVNQSLPAITVTDVAGNVSAPAGEFNGINQDTVAPVLSAAINAAASRLVQPQHGCGGRHLHGYRCSPILRRGHSDTVQLRPGC